MIALLSACTFQPGGAFTTLTQTTLSGVVEAEDAPGELVLQVDAIVLQSLSSTVRFDETDPQPPFTLCHNGHCHHEDGSLWSITEIEVWLAGDEATWEDVLVLSGGELDMLSGETLVDDEPVDLPMLSAEQVVVEVHDIDGRLARIEALLLHHGLTEIVTEKEEALVHTKLSNVYAHRPRHQS